MLMCHWFSIQIGAPFKRPMQARNKDLLNVAIIILAPAKRRRAVAVKIFNKTNGLMSGVSTLILNDKNQNRDFHLFHIGLYPLSPQRCVPDTQTVDFGGFISIGPPDTLPRNSSVEVSLWLIFHLCYIPEVDDSRAS